MNSFGYPSNDNVEQPPDPNFLHPMAFSEILNNYYYYFFLKQEQPIAKR